jgi:hypothetical protein
MRGRVMSLWFVAFQGSTPIGGPLVGLVMSGFGARAGLGLGAATIAVVGVCGLLALRRLPRAGVGAGAVPGSASGSQAGAGRRSAPRAPAPA